MFNSKLTILVVVFFLFIDLVQGAGEFLPNKGQIEYVGHQEGLQEAPQFYFKGHAYDVYFFQDRVSYVLKNIEQVQANMPMVQREMESTLFRVDMTFGGQAELKGLGLEKVHKKYLKNPTIIEIKESYSALIYENLFPGVDLYFYEEDGTLEYDIVVSAHADFDELLFHYEGGEQPIIKNGKMVIETPLGSLTQYLPATYQMNNEAKEHLMCYYILEGNAIRFDVPHYDRKRNLIIDPWSTFVGGADIEESYSVAVDQRGNTYTSGYTGSVNFPVTPGALQVMKQGQYDAFITKLDTTGNEIWSTYYGGIGDETAYEVLVDKADNPYLVGYTNGNDLLVSGSGVFQSSSNGSYDAFILKLDSSGNFLWGTYYGGTGGEFALCGAVDESNNVIIAGYTSSSDLPVVNAFQSGMGGALDAFTAKFDSTGNLIWSTYCGGTNSEDAHAIHADSQNNIIVSGETYSSDFPISSGAFQNGIAGSKDIFIVKYDSLGNRVFSTFFGGSTAEDGIGITSDVTGNFYLVGYSESLDFPMLGNGIYQSTKSTGKDGFVVKFKPSGFPIRSTFIGATAEDRLTTAAVSNTGAIYVAGYSTSTDLNMIGNPFQASNYGLSDGFYFKMDSALTPNYSTYIGGVSAEYLHDMQVSNQNQVLTFSGFSFSNDFPTTNGVFQDSLAGQSDGFVFQSDSTTIITTFGEKPLSGEEVTVYPTLFNNEFTIASNEVDLTGTQAVIYDAMGRLIINRKLVDRINKIELNESIESGVYVLTVLKNGYPIKTKKLIKQ